MKRSVMNPIDRAVRPLSSEGGIMSTTADGIAYRLVGELENLIELAGNAMRQANAD